MPVAKPSFGDVIAAVSDRETDFGVLPMENSCAGPVAEVQQLLALAELPILSTHKLQVRMHLLAKEGTELETIRRVVSHPVALAQCAKTLSALGLSTEPASNTAAAAKMVAEGEDPTVAALASEAAAAIYGLAILRRDVHDEPDNATTFCVIGRASR
jgi:prephenate dehydratase